jgi:hypothetical protein
MKRYILTGIIFCALCSQANGAAVRDLNLEDLCRGAGKIFWGRCAGVETQDEALVYTFGALRMLKGGPADTVTLRMHKAASMYARAPRFTAGQEVLLFLYPESDLGYSSPVGFGQGVFRIAATGSGEKTAVNERGNSRLFKGMNMEQLCPGATFPGIRQCSLSGTGALRHEEFMELIRQIIAGGVKP